MPVEVANALCETDIRTFKRNKRSADSCGSLSPRVVLHETNIALLVCKLSLTSGLLALRRGERSCVVRCGACCIARKEPVSRMLECLSTSPDDTNVMRQVRGIACPCTQQPQRHRSQCMQGLWMFAVHSMCPLLLS
eukprot:1384440-Amphidinium_carterae.1